MVLDKISVWIQLQNLPPGYRKKEVLEAWCKRVGKVLFINLTPRGDGKSVRVRVRLDVNKPLARFLSITKDGKKVFYQVYYEKKKYQNSAMCAACWVTPILGTTMANMRRRIWNVGTGL